MKRIDLGGTWRLSVEGVTDSPINCAIPGDGLGALIDAGLAPDPFYGQNELALQYLNDVDWVFERVFELDAGEAAQAHSILYFESIDTVAEIAVNGHEVAKGANMFAAIGIDAGGFLKPGANRIRIVCRSAQTAAATLAEALPYPIPHVVHPIQSPHRNLIRKAQCHSGWDWGPCLMSAGIYGQAYIDFSQPGWIKNLSARTIKETDVWRVEAEVAYLVHPGDGDRTIEYTFQLLEADSRRIIDSRTGRRTIVSGLAYFAENLRISDPSLWWPAGYGQPACYKLTVAIRKVDAPAEESQTVEKTIGFRDLAVISDRDALGRSLVFRVNGRDVWAKGANWIPVDALPGRRPRKTYERLLRSMVEANMNMVRLWGGGIYETDDFYQLCDELGILIWHDFMFACSLYPSDPDFLNIVRAELQHQILRLKEHPAIALWCGNNENVGALNWFAESKTNRDRYLINYDRLNEGVVGATVKNLDPSRAWWPSSPSAGPDDYTDCWHSDGRGDMHYWSVWHEGKSFENYYETAPRFCSEFGYQSFPSAALINTFCPPDERNLSSPTMEHHQRSKKGNAVIIENFTRYFRFPENFDSLVYLSQVQQALAIKMAVEYWRGLRPVCMGALYWQLNDNWPAASWSSIDYGLTWKLLHYAARRFFAPVSIIVYNKGGRIAVVLVNDEGAAVSGAVALRGLDFAGRLLWRCDLAATAAAEAATPVWSAELRDLPFKADEGFLVADFTPESASYSVLSAARPSAYCLNARNELFLTEPKRCRLAPPTIAATVGADEDGVFVDLVTDKPAFYLALELRGKLAAAGRWSDNWLTLLPEDRRRIRFLSWDGDAAIKVDDLRAALTIRDLRSTYD